MKLLQILSLLIFLILPSQARQVFGVEYDQAYYVLFNGKSAEKEQIFVFDADGKPSKAVMCAALIQTQSILDSLDKFFKDSSSFSILEGKKRGLMVEVIVFYNKGDFVMSISDAGLALDVQPSLDKERQLSMTQSEEYDKILNEIRRRLIRSHSLIFGSDQSKATQLYWEQIEIDGKLPNKNKN